MSADTPPKDAFVAVQYDNRWFWIAGTDIQSKNTFAIIMLLFFDRRYRSKGVGARRHDPCQLIVYSQYA